MPKEKRPILEVEGVPEWLVTFGDMMSLLLTFFILLFSISEIKEPGRIYDLVQTFKAKLNSKRPIFGYTLPRMEMSPDGMMKELFEKPDSIGEAGTSSNPVKVSEGESSSVRTIRDNLHLLLKGSVHFAEGKASLLEEGRKILYDYVIPGIEGGRYKIVILGHAAPGEASDLEGEYFLGFNRARSIREYLVRNDIDPKRIEIQSAGSRVVARNDIDNQVVRDLRRRVDILISPQVMGPPAEG